MNDREERKDRVRLALPLALAAIAGLLALPTRSSSSSSSASPPASASASVDFQPCSPDVLTLIGDSRQLGGWSVVRISCPVPRTADLEISQGFAQVERRLLLTVAAKGALPHSAPASVGAVELFYGGEKGMITPAEIEALLAQLAERVRARASTLPPSW